MARQTLKDGQWIGGCDSSNYTLGPGFYQWGQNTVNRGGIVGTRQGFAEVDAILNQDPRGLTIVTIGGVAWLLAAIGRKIYRMNLNQGAGLVEIAGLDFPLGKRQVHFEVCVQAQETLPDGTTRQKTPKLVVIMQDGSADPQYWDGNRAGKIHPLYPDGDTTPKGDYMKWAGDRLWVAKGRQLYASDLLNPFQFLEQDVTASGGFFFLPDNVSGMGVTHDYKSLLVFTPFTTSALQVGLEDRTVWPNTQDFQRVILPSIGCASHRTIINQYGMTWWMSHDGLIGLDNALSAYQSSKLDIQDQNMIRSKEGLSWGNDGGCAGAFGNFLMFSVPSGNKWNNHTWVLDQAVINTLAGMTPPAWSSNWTGIRPEQWVTGKILGRQRCFCISRDLVDQGHQSTVWEAFIGQKMDVPKVGVVRKAKDIGCALETKFMGLASNQYARLKWVELDVAEIIGNVWVDVYYCGRRTSYKRILHTRLNATVTGESGGFDEGGVKVYVPQFRTVRSVTDTHEEDDLDSEVQTPYLRDTDKEFSVLVLWSGQMTITEIRMALDPITDYQEGLDYPDEDKARRITTEGEGFISPSAPPPNKPTGQLTSKIIAPMRPRWVELPSYDSAVPNGVFFVAELTATPPPGAYPDNLYPMEVTLTSETQGIDVYYTKNGQRPHGPPNPVGTLYTPATKPSMVIGQTLKAVGERDGMLPSVLLSGQYTKAKVATPTANPVAGDFAPDDFPVSVALACATPAATIRYVINDSQAPCVTHNSTAYTVPINVAANKYLHIRAFKDHYITSDEHVGRYHRLPKCATPTCTPDTGDYPASDYNPTKTIEMATATSGARLRYTINSTDFENDGHTFNNDHHQLEVHADDVVRVKAIKSGSIDSDVKTATYTVERVQVETPSLDPQNGTAMGQNHTMHVTFDCDTPNATIAYTLTPSTVIDHPTHTNGTHINTYPTTISFQVGHKTIRAIAFRSDMDDSEEIVGEYDHEQGN